MKLKKLFAILLTLCLVVFAFTACNNEPPTTNLPTTPEQTTPVIPSEPSNPVEPSNPNNPSENESDKPTTPEKPTIPEQPDQPEKPVTPEQPDTPIIPPIAATEKAYEISEDGKTVYFGSYPTTQVADNSVIASLSAIVGDPSDSDNWTSYGYYISGEVQDFMRYADVEYNSVKYRGIYFTSYRPYYTTIESSEQRSYQDENGYTVNTTYWFAYETLSWKVLSKSDGTFIGVISVSFPRLLSNFSTKTSKNRANPKQA